MCSGIHTRLSAEIIEQQKQVDCLGQYHLTPPSIYLYPRTMPAVRNNPAPEPHTPDQVGFPEALSTCFGGYDDETNKVRFLVAN